MKPREKSALKGVIVLFFCVVTMAVTAMFFLKYLVEMFSIVFLVTVFVLDRHFFASCPKCGGWNTSWEDSTSFDSHLGSYHSVTWRVCSCGHEWSRNGEILSAGELFRRGPW